MIENKVQEKKSTTFHNFSEGPLGLGRHRRHLHCNFSWMGLRGQHRCWSNQWLRPRRLGWCVPTTGAVHCRDISTWGGICLGYLKGISIFSRLPYFNILSRFPKSWGEPHIIQLSWMTILVLNHAAFFSGSPIFSAPPFLLSMDDGLIWLPGLVMTNSLRTWKWP